MRPYDPWVGERSHNILGLGFPFLPALKAALAFFPL
jgi:hypothetical protein